MPATPLLPPTPLLPLYCEACHKQLVAPQQCPCTQPRRPRVTIDPSALKSQKSLNAKAALAAKSIGKRGVDDDDTRISHGVGVPHSPPVARAPASSDTYASRNERRASIASIASPPPPSTTPITPISSSPLTAESAYPSEDPFRSPTELRARQTYPWTHTRPSKGLPPPSVPAAHAFLYPGARFAGAQKSGRNSYCVDVTVIDVDFSSSYLCGYLRIRGLTQDWPELTTFFDAEIVGSRYGFRTDAWDASEQEDLYHWGRFPAFKPLKDSLRGPRLTLPNSVGTDAVFMRWKERFLVPDHRVQDISGASFAGFYYMCIEPGQPSEPLDLMPNGIGGTGALLPDPNSQPTRGGATMSGFYYHQNSEPYQQLTLQHVPRRTTTSYEFR